ncbi:MAG: ribosome small subunit-dependent GTPase A [Spirochaetaceae bacterium]|jgi:ribosome biogenesis GTPase|nr:ribosome small subunit-dependent GTPase A [Spirochaetaceae bacterium]
MTGRIVSGSRNIFVVQTADRPPEIYECRIKGKVLKGKRAFYNPLAPGDSVEFDAGKAGKEEAGTGAAARANSGIILGVEERRNMFTRLNLKGKAPQLLAANIDLVLCMTSPVSPPFRPRFIDRLLLQADAAEIPALIVCNKMDLYTALDGSSRRKIEGRLADFERLGYTVARISAQTGRGMDALKKRLKGKCAVLVGQSGCGKTSLINALLPHAKQRTGELNQKYDRGNHTTVMSVLFEDEEAGLTLIDTPGIRHLVPEGIAPGDVQHLMRDFAPYAGKCAFGLSCTHETEAGCKVREALEDGRIHEDRFESFIRITGELQRCQVLK